jgi:hypothetical protein
MLNMRRAPSTGDTPRDVFFRQMPTAQIEPAAMREAPRRADGERSAGPPCPQESALAVRAPRSSPVAV